MTIGTKWIKPADCESAHCVEVRRTSVNTFAIRNDNEPRYTAVFSPAEWRSFIASVKAGHYDDLDIGD
jgi:Domain of unknown function (DUF397)